VNCGERTVVARVHRLKHVQRLRPATLADHDPVGAHAQRVAEEIADAHLAGTLDVCRPCLERDDVHLLQPDLRRVLDRDDPLARRDKGGQRVEQRRLTGACAAGNHDIQATVDACAQELRGVRGDGSVAQEV
jgi:hypothetical protein